MSDDGWGDAPGGMTKDDWNYSPTKKMDFDERPEASSEGKDDDGFATGGFGGGDTGFRRGGLTRGTAPRGRGGFGGNSGFGASSRAESDHWPRKNSGYGGSDFDKKDGDRDHDDGKSGFGNSGFGSSGFGSSGFGKSGFGNSDFGSGASSGFGHGGNGGGACYNCGEEGHQSRDCPQPRKSRDLKCYNCGGEGHQVKDCPEARKPRNDKCYNCQGEGHQSRDCPEPRKPREDNRRGRGFEGSESNFGASGFGGRDNSSGFGGRGDSSGFGGRDNSSGFGGRGDSSGFGGRGDSSGFGGGDTCFGNNKREDGFGDRKFGSATSSGFGGSSTGFGGGEKDRGFSGGGFGGRGGFGDGDGRDRKCFNCKQEGHRSNECPMPKNQACFNCGQSDHISRECPNPPKLQLERLDEQRKPFIPKDEDVELLYKEHIEQGELFPKLFEAEVTLTQGGLHGRSEKGKKISSFAEIELPEEIAKNVQSCGYKNPTPIQQYAIPAIFKGRDLMACAQTGSGKTAAFLLPIMTTLIRTNNLCEVAERTCCPRCIIIAPTRELAVQIYNEGRKFANGTALNVACIYGGAAVMIQRQQLRRGATLIVATVGRLKHFIDEGYISLREVKYLLLDEADRMLDMGFEDSINFIFNHPSLTAKEERQTLMFSATFPPEVQTVASQQLKSDFLMITCGKIGVANTCIHQEIIEVTTLEEKREKLLELLRADLDKDASVFTKKTMVFVSRKIGADVLGVFVSQNGIPSTTIHGDRGQNLRAEAINDFKYGRKPVLIATAVGERGLDIKGVDHVINYDLPNNGEDYVHRIGRTGRVGNPGRATSFYYAPDDRALAQSLVEILTEAGQDVPEFLSMEASGSSSRFAGFGGGANTAADAEAEEW